MPVGSMDFGDQRLPDRFWDKVSPEPNTGCWLWSGAVGHRGYGQFNHSLTGRAHRLIALTCAGLESSSLVVDHVCRQHPCVNPQHLDLVSQKENVLRGEGLAAKNAVATHCKHGHAMTAENSPRDSRGKRRCIACEEARWERRKAKRMDVA